MQEDISEACINGRIRVKQNKIHSKQVFTSENKRANFTGSAEGSLEILGVLAQLATGQLRATPYRQITHSH
jgi:hypothetical protein